MNLTGRVAVITGAGRGLGKAIALAFELSGANVTLFSLLEDELKDIAADLEKLGGEYLLHTGDVSDEHDAASVVAETFARFSRIDILQVNAIDPGLMDTTMGNEIRAMGPDVLGEGLYNRMIGYKEQGILKDPRDIADLAAFLASSDSGNMTGHIGTPKYYRTLGWNPSEPNI